MLGLTIVKGMKRNGATNTMTAASSIPATARSITLRWS